MPVHIRKRYAPLSRPICDPILKKLKGRTKDISAYWRRFCKVDIITSYHYIKVGDTYKRHTMPHEYNHTSSIRSTSDYGWNTNRSSNNIHPASPGCRPGTYPLIKEEAEEELQNKQTSRSRHDHRVTCTCNCCCRICEPRGLSNPITMGIKTSKA